MNPASLSTLFSPLLVCVALSGLLPLVHRRLRPRMSAAVLAANVLWISVVSLLGIWFVSLRYLTHLGRLVDQLPWCSSMVGTHDSVPGWLGFPAFMVAVIGAVRFRRFGSMQKTLRRSKASGVSVVSSDEVFAYVLPGRNAPTLISTGLLTQLNADERTVVLAHEKAHADYRHDRYLTFARGAEILVPFVRPLTKRLAFSLERWADDVAANAVSGNRRLVAHTIAKVALLMPQGFKPALSFSGLGEAARTRYLLHPSKPLRSLTGVALASSAIGLGFALYQLHHFEALLSSLCHS